MFLCAYTMVNVYITGAHEISSRVYRSGLGEPHHLVFTRYCSPKIFNEL